MFVNQIPRLTPQLNLATDGGASVHNPVDV